MTTAREEVKEIELSHIRATQGNDRLRDIDTLAKSIAAVGLQIPLIVQHIDNEVEQYRLVDGHRRFAALKKNKAKTARVIEINADLSGDKMQTIQLTANLHRLQLTAFEEAAAIKKLRDDGRETKDIAADLGMTPQAVARREQLNKLTPEWMKYIAAMREGKALSVAAFEMIAAYEPSVQGKLLQSYSKSSNVPTVNDVKRELSAFDRTLKSAPWKLDDAILFPAAGACNACPKRSSCQSLLFDGEVDGKNATPEDKCLDIACWNKKLEKFGKLKLEAAKEKYPNLVLLSASPSWNERANRVVPGLSRGNQVFQKRSWGSNDFEPAKKSDKDAVPAMTINEKGLGSISYIKINKTAEPKEPTKAEAKKLTPEQELKIEQEQVIARRKQWVIDSFIKTMRAEVTVPAVIAKLPADDHLKLLSVMLDDRRKNRDVKPVINFRAIDLAKAITKLYSFAFDNFDDPREWIDNKEVVAILIGSDLADLEAEAVKAIPDPKPKAGAAPKKKAGKK